MLDPDMSRAPMGTKGVLEGMSVAYGQRIRLGCFCVLRSTGDSPSFTLGAAGIEPASYRVAQGQCAGITFHGLS
jgi:hypothetical protein